MKPVFKWSCRELNDGWVMIGVDVDLSSPDEPECMLGLRRAVHPFQFDESNDPVIAFTAVISEMDYRIRKGGGDGRANSLCLACVRVWRRSMSPHRFRELSPGEYRKMLEGVQQVIQPFVRAKLDVMNCTLPTMIIARTDDGITMTTSYPPEVQAHFDRCDSMCKDAVAYFLRQEGYTLPEQGQ